MARRHWKFGLLFVFFALGAGGCDCKGRIQSLIYKDVDRTITPTQQRQEAEGENREVEPNDSAEEATPITLNREMRPMQGAIDPAGDIDWFSLEPAGDEGWLVEVNVIPEDSDLNVALYLQVPGPGDHPPLLYDIAPAGETESIPMLKVPAGEQRRFFVSGADGTSGDYRIEIRRRLSAGAVAFEPNDYPHLAVELQFPGEIQGFYQRPHDRDVFYVPAESLQAGVYSLELSNIPEIAQTLRIYGDESLESPLMSIPVSGDRPAVIPNLSLGASAGGGLYFVLTAGENFDRERGYRLRVIEHPRDGNFIIEREPNNTPGSAQLVRMGDVVRGYLHVRDDVDRFRFVIEPEADEEPVDDELLAPQSEEEEEVAVDDEPEIFDPWAEVEEKEGPEYVVQVRLRPLGEAHRLALRWIPDEESGERPLDLHADDEEQGLILCNHVLGPGEYDVEVRALETMEGFRPRSFDYEIEFRNLAGERGLEIEPNDRIEEADRLPMGSSRVGYISTDGDVDYYAFVVGPDQVQVLEREEAADGFDDGDDGDEESAQESEDLAEGIELAGPAAAWQPPETESVRVRLRGNRLNLRFEILDDEGGRVANVNRAGPGADEELTIDLPHGLYYLAISATSGSLCEPYRIEVMEN